MDRSHGRLQESLIKIEALLQSGRDAEAILLANAAAFCDTGGAEKLLKANFNPDEPCDQKGRWTTGVGSERAHLEDVQYRGHVHDAVVDDLLGALEKQGDRVLKGPVLTAHWDQWHQCNS